MSDTVYTQDDVVAEFTAYLAAPWACEDRASLFHRMRSLDPVYRGADGTYFLTGYDVADAAFRHPQLSRKLAADRTFRKIGVEGVDRPEVVKTADVVMTWLVNTDEPMHARLRGLVSSAFSPRAMKGMQQRVDRLVEGLLDAIEPLEEFDFLHAIGYPLPEQLICDILGVPQTDMERIVELTNISSGFNSITGGSAEDVRRMAQDALVEMVAYFRALVETRRQDPRDDLITRLMGAQEDGERLNADELVGMLMQLVTAGHHTTAHLIANAMRAMIENPDQWALVKARPELAKPMIEETLRLDPSSAGLPRVATEAVELGGKTIAKGDQVIIVMRAANRDPARFADPDRFLIERQGNHHLSFGRGSHLCLGNWLARMEAIATFEGLARRGMDFEITTDRLEFHQSQLTPLVRLPVRRIRAGSA